MWMYYCERLDLILALGAVGSLYSMGIFLVFLCVSGLY